MSKLLEPYPANEYGQQSYPAGQTTHTTVIIRENGCCSLRARVQWVIGFNIVLGIINLGVGINMATIAARFNFLDGEKIWGTYAGLGITVGILMIAAGVCLACALSKETPVLFTAWFLLIGLYAILNIAWLGYAGYIYGKYTAGYDARTNGLIANGVINFIIQVACVLTVIQYKQSTLH
ncbi:hypothetical protein BV898_03264 [Hypsibius exemplaris]|uniref:MARVEL domain-containing protein n=1 Tax=Hypsibius exemplaris TaxID=2072580 RepID=A0A1W0X689_HYPEX|nr:hypothetical protein BV898_03264 [Hypsibius exemplaris]